MVDRLGEQLSKLLVVEDLKAATTGDLADGSGVEAVVVVAIPALHEYASVTQTLCVHLSSNIVQVNTYDLIGDKILAGKEILDNYLFFFFIDFKTLFHSIYLKLSTKE